MNWNFHDILITERQKLPIDWQRVKSYNELFVEIGFGNGEFTNFLAEKHPDDLIVGIEVSQMCVTKACRRVLASGVKNVRLMHGDAGLILRKSFAPHTVSKVFMNFPCPWPKSRHASRRVTVPSFVNLLNYLLKIGGQFRLATDVEWYAMDCAEIFSCQENFSVAPLLKNPTREYITKYERKWQKEGRNTFDLVITKIANKEDNEREQDIMEEIFEIKGNVAEVMQHLTGVEGVGTDGTGHYVFRDYYMSPDRVGIMLVITSDEGFEQHFYMKFLPRGEKITMKLDPIGHPYRTPAVKAAIKRALQL